TTCRQSTSRGVADGSARPQGPVRSESAAGSMRRSGDRRSRPSRALHGLANSSELAQVQQVMARVQPHQMLDALLPALGVNTDPLPRLSGVRANQTQVAGAQDAQLVEGLGEISAVVVKPVGPAILIVALDRRPILGEDAANPVAPYDLAVGEVAHHLQHG